MAKSKSTAKVVQPFSLSRLPQVTRAEATMVNHWLDLLPNMGLSGTFQKSLEEVFQKYLGLDFQFQQKDVTTLSFQKILNHLPEEGFYALIGLTAAKYHAILHVDLTLARVLIDKTLGGSGSVEMSHKPLTPIDEGVLSYLLLKGLSHLHHSLKGSAALHLRLHQCERRRGALGELYPAQEPSCLMTWSIQAGEFSGFANLILPGPFLSKVLIEPFSHRMGQTEVKALEERLGYFGKVPATLWGELGHADLSLEEFQSLREGDVLLLDEAYSYLEDKKLSGLLHLHVGKGEAAGLGAELMKIDRRHVSCKLMEGVEEVFE